MELRLKRQWLVAHPANKNPIFFKEGQFYNASVSRHLSSQWMSFEEVTTLALTHNLAIGFVIMEGEDITCIDLDVKPNTTKEAARKMGLPFDYVSRPNWRTYQSYLTLAAQVRKAIRQLRPRDMIDLQSFLWVQGSDEYA